MSEEDKGFKIRDRRINMDEDIVEEVAEDVHSSSPEKKSNPVSEQTPTTGKSSVQINFSSFLFSLGSSAFIALGEEENPFTGKKSINLSQAQESIDLLNILQEKTQGNLSKEEESLLNNLLFSVRMKYIELAGKPDSPKG